MNNNELITLQSLPLEVKIAKSKLRIEEFVRYMGGEDKVYISFSGGKDSTVLLHLVRSVYPNVEAVFSNTGLEFPELRKFALSFNNVTEIRPKITFKQVVTRYGYPMISKKVARMIKDCQNPTQRNERSRAMYFSDYILDEEGNKKEVKNVSYRLSKQYRYLATPDCPVKISNRCCDKLKKEPLHKWEKESGKRPFIGTMASESQMRKQSYMVTGCNAFSEGKEKSMPLGFWTENDIFEYILKFGLNIAEPYGDIVKDEEGNWTTTGEKRTGCIWCGFGVHLEKEPNRYQRLQKTHPKLWEYCMDKMGLKEVCEYMGIPYEWREEFEDKEEYEEIQSSFIEEIEEHMKKKRIK